jgi:hypothetical protein
MPWRIIGALGMLRVIGETTVLEGKGDVREVGRENPVNEQPSRADSVDILLKRYVPRQLETVEIAG